MIIWTGGGLFLGAASAQLVSYSSDMVTRQACDAAAYQVGVIWIFNHTDRDLPLKWELTQNVIPVEGSPFLIIDPIQYVPYAQGGMIGLYPLDSTEALFHFYLADDMSPGDSAIYQIRIYAPEDSANTDQLLTAILFCPETTSVDNADTAEAFIISPNPFRSTTTIQLSMEFANAHLVIHNLNGEKLRTIPVDKDKVEIERGNLASGVYLVSLIQEGRVIGTSRILVTD